MDYSMRPGGTMDTSQLSQMHDARINAGVNSQIYIGSLDRMSQTTFPLMPPLSTFDAIRSFRHNNDA